ncbi:MAG: hypothetical protein ACR2NZ_09790 [Rubripirellula sp.]
MGGVPVLLMMAALGITYGWQPDNDDGVEYIIQIHPEELRELRTIGEVTSVIDPEVRGHVSRIVFQVGDVELPRETPDHLVRKPRLNGEPMVTANDHSPIPIPQLGGSSAPATLVPTLNAAANSRPGAVMKPQTGTPPPSGFSLPPSLATAAQQAGQAVDMAGRPINPAAVPQGNVSGTTFSGGVDPNSGFRVPPPSTRAPTNQTVAAPAFTGPMPSSTPLATSRAGGPTTDPTSSRDSSWNQFSTPPPTAATSAGASPTQSNVPNSLIPTNPFANQTSNAPAPATGFGASPVSSADTFGRTPSGLSTTPTGQPNAYGATTPSSSAGQRGAFVQVPSTESIFNKGQATGVNQAAPSSQASSYTNQTPTGAVGSYGTSTTYPPQTPNRSIGLPPGTSSFGQTSTTSASQLPGRFGVNPSAATNNTYRGTNTSNSFSAPNGYATQGSKGARPDPSLSPAQVAAGAWSVDAYGQPVDRSGRPVTVANATTTARAAPARAAPARAAPTRASAQAGQPSGSTFAAPSTTGRGSFSSLGSPTPNSNPILQTSGQQSSFGYGQSNSSPGSAQTRLGQAREPVSPSASRTFATNQPTGSSTRAGGPTLPTQNVTQASSSGSGSLTAPKRVAAQPLFNGLLLISVVANVYLIFWLKNLRVQYHDLVAAKRIASSGNAAAS